MTVRSSGYRNNVNGSGSPHRRENARQSGRRLAALCAVVVLVTSVAVISARQTGASEQAVKYNTGAMRFFVLRSKPKPVPRLKFVDAGGQERSISEWRGRVVLLNLWATWCAPCREEMPALNKLQKAVGGVDFEVVAVSIDKQGLEKSGAFLKELGVEDLELYADPTGKVSSDMNSIGLPMTFLFDRDQREIGWYAGALEWDSPEAIKLIRAAIDGKLQTK